MSGSYSPEERLWQAVILQALIDCAGLSKRVESKLKPALLKEIENESADWFRSMGQDFIDICTFAGWQPSKTKRFAERLIERDEDAIDALLTLRSLLLHRGATSERSLNLE
tara:strand:- start:87 stop:419 length:333 start_codon:yes stop_codon:yes gene_type:complete